MENTIIKNHNSRVGPDDTVFFLGDFCFKNSAGGKKGEGTLNKAEHYIKQLNGRFIFIKGNHDNNNSLKTIINHMVIEHGGYKMFLVHDPKDMDKKYKINLVGHVHEKWKFDRRNGSDLINVGCDQWGFKPVNIAEIMKEYMKYKKGEKDGRKNEP